MDITSRHTLKRGFIALGILSFVLILFLFGQIHSLQKALKNQQNQVDTANTGVINLQSNIATLNNTLTNFQNTETDLKHLQALNASMALTLLQNNLLQGVSKTILLSNASNLQSLISELHSNLASSSLLPLQNALANLPNIDPATTISQLSTLKPTLANLNFVNAIPQAIMPTSTNSAHGFKEAFQMIWQQIKSLIIVRSDNAIGTQLVSDTARFDAVRTLNLLIDEAQWQILTAQDPSNTLTQLKINVLAYTQADQNQAAWLTQLAQIQSGNYYTNAEIQPVISAINNLQQALSLQ